MFENWSLKSRTLGVFTIVATCLLVISIVGGLSLKAVTKNFNHIVHVNFPKALELTNIRGSEKDLYAAVVTLLRTHASAAEVASQKELATNAIKKFEENSANFEKMEWSPGEEALWSDVKKQWPVFKEMSYKLLALSESGSKDDEIIRDRLGATEFLEAKNKAENNIQKMVDFQSKDSQFWSANAESAANVGNIISFALSGGGFLLALFIGYWFSTRLSKELTVLSDEMLKNAASVADSSKHVSHAGTELSSSTSEQAAALQETVSAIEQVSSMVQKNADNAKRSEEFSIASHETVMKGKQAVESVIHSIDDIRTSNTDITQQIEKSNQQIADIVKVIAEIGNKTKVINDIVFQTKLLSFNASVEAARAGEHGKGFAVVAEEVGNLAQMSGNAAKEISEMLEGSIQKVEGIVTESKTKVERLVSTAKQNLEAGISTAKNCDDVLNEIVKNVDEVNQMIGEIASASREQAQGVQEINKAMAQMDQVTHQNANASQEVAKDGEELNAESESLRSLVHGLIHIVRGGNDFAAANEATLNGTAIANQGQVNTKMASHSTSKKVVALKRKEPSLTSTSSSAKLHVVPQVASPVIALPVKKSGAGDALPARDDARFEDV